MANRELSQNCNCGSTDLLHASWNWALSSSLPKLWLNRPLSSSMSLGIEQCSSRIVCVPRALSQFLVELWNLLLMTQRGWSLVDRDNWAEEPIETIGQRGRTYWNGWLANFANFARPVRLNLKRPTVEQMQMNKYKWSLTQIHRASRWIKCKYNCCLKRFCSFCQNSCIYSKPYHMKREKKKCWGRVPVARY